MLTKSSSSGLFVSMLTFILELSLFMLGSDQSRIYVHVPDTVTWSKAQNYCREYYTDLVTLRNYDDIIQLQSPCHWKAYCWIGLQREQSGSNVWKWSNGETSNFTNWNVNQPDDYDGDENCAIMGSFFWSDVPCGYSNAFLCYDEPILVQESKTWEEALEHCRNLSGSFTRNDHFYDLLHPGYRGFNLTSRKVILDAQTQEVWIGLRFLAGNWLWMDGNPLSEQLPACPAAGKFCEAKLSPHPMAVIANSTIHSGLHLLIAELRLTHCSKVSAFVNGVSVLLVDATMLHNFISMNPLWGKGS
ncbi:hypothetical protein Q8A73_001902 [Channa argus]|nr:hypothetical protein Q8A73_001902 [Channa argus]